MRTIKIIFVVVLVGLLFSAGGVSAQVAGTGESGWRNFLNQVTDFISDIPERIRETISSGEKEEVILETMETERVGILDNVETTRYDERDNADQSGSGNDQEENQEEDSSSSGGSTCGMAGRVLSSFGVGSCPPAGGSDGGSGGGSGGPSEIEEVPGGGGLGLGGWEPPNIDLPGLSGGGGGSGSGGGGGGSGGSGGDDFSLGGGGDCPSGYVDIGAGDTVACVPSGDTSGGGGGGGSSSGGGGSSSSSGGGSSSSGGGGSSGSSSGGSGSGGSGSGSSGGGSGSGGGSSSNSGGGSGSGNGDGSSSNTGGGSGDDSGSNSGGGSDNDGGSSNSGGNSGGGGGSNDGGSSGNDGSGSVSTGGALGRCLRLGFATVEEITSNPNGEIPHPAILCEFWAYSNWPSSKEDFIDQNLAGYVDDVDISNAGKVRGCYTLGGYCLKPLDLDSDDLQ